MASVSLPGRASLLPACSCCNRSWVWSRTEQCQPILLPRSLWRIKRRIEVNWKYIVIFHPKCCVLISLISTFNCPVQLYEQSHNSGGGKPRSGVLRQLLHECLLWSLSCADLKLLTWCWLPGFLMEILFFSSGWYRHLWKRIYFQSLMSRWNSKWPWCDKCETWRP